MTPSPETSPSQLGHTITAAPLGTGWAKTLVFLCGLVHLFRSDECRGFDWLGSAPFTAIDIAAALRLLEKSTMAKTSVSPKAKIKNL